MIKLRWSLLATVVAVLLGVGLWTTTLHAQSGLPESQAITYQGYLTDESQPADGSYDFTFTLFPTMTGGSPVKIGGTITDAALSLEDVAVADGIFTVQLDFGRGVFTGEPRYLEIGVRAGNSTGGYTVLAPRQLLSPAPAALALPGLWTQPYSVSVSLIGGYPGNSVDPGVIGATIGGGGQLSTGSQNGPNRVVGEASFATIAGGNNNVISGTNAFIGGGANNVAAGSLSVIGGGWFNSTTDTSGVSVIAGGYGNDMDSPFGFIGGGFNNQVNTSNNAVVAGGSQNKVSDSHSAVGGGTQNQAGNANNDPFDAEGATVPGGVGNVASGAYSFAAGHFAQAMHPGSFVWADNSGSTFSSTANNQVRFRATGGFQIATNDVGAGVKLDNGDTAWEVLSDRNVKTDFTPVDGTALLDNLAEIPITQWRYLWEDPQLKHIGPMAQDFYAAFGLGSEEKYIGTLDADGVALAGVQALYDLAKQQQAQIEALQQQNAELSARVDALEGE